MTEFKTTILGTYNAVETHLSKDQKKWSQLGFPIIVKHFTPVDYVHACPNNPHIAAVTAGFKVTIYSTRSGRGVGTISRFKERALGACYRADGKLLVAGSDDGFIRLFDCKNNDQLRVFKGHSGPVRRVKFLNHASQIVSFSNDATVALWDIGSEQSITTFRGHEDFIRAGSVSGDNPHLIVSGSYDKRVKVWDIRCSGGGGDGGGSGGSSGGGAACVFTLDHGDPVEDVICYPNSPLVASAGGSEVRIWDLVAGKLLCKLSRHHKTINCLGFASKGSRLVSGSSDYHLKFYDTTNYQVVHDISCSAPVLSFAVMVHDQGLVVGMLGEGGSGLVSLQKKKSMVPSKDVESQGKRKKSDGLKIVAADEPTKFSKPDNLLRKFENSRFLDQALKNSRAHVTIALFAELIRRGGMQSALAGRSDEDLHLIVLFARRNFRNPSYQPVLLDLVTILLDVYEDQVTDGSPLMKLILELRRMVSDAITQAKCELLLEGNIRMGQSASNYSSVSRLNMPNVDLQ